MSRERRVSGSGARFLAAGAFTTLVTLGLYLLLLMVLPYALAYSLVFVLGVGMSYLLNSTFVFRSSANARTAAVFPLIYVVQYAVGLAVAALWVDVLHLPETAAALAAITVTVPITYVLARRLFTWQGSTHVPKR